MKFTKGSRDGLSEGARRQLIRLVGEMEHGLMQGENIIDVQVFDTLDEIRCVLGGPVPMLADAKTRVRCLEAFKHTQPR